MFICLLAGVLASVSPAMRVVAQQVPQSTTVTSRVIPELTPAGVEVSNFILHSSFGYSGIYDDNVFATSAAKFGNYISVFTPTARLDSNFANHSLGLSGFASIRRNHEFSSEDTEDWGVVANGRLRISRDASISGGGSAGQNHLNRSSPNDNRGLTPTKFKTAGLFARYDHQFGKLATALNARALRKVFANVPAIRNGQLVELDNSDRDRTESSIGFRLSYERQTNYQPFFLIQTDIRDYDQLQNLTGLDRSSEGFDAIVGLQFDAGGLVFGEVSVGYGSQNYRAPYPDIRTPLINANVDWNATKLMTVNLRIDRIIRESIDAFFSGYIETRGSLSVDYELRRNLILSGGFDYVVDDFQGIDPADREDNWYYFSAGARYILNRNFSFSLNYNYLQRDIFVNNVTISSFDFNKNIVFFTILAQL